MEATAGAVPSSMMAPSEVQQVQSQATEHQLFDYLVALEKNLGGAAQFTDPLALAGSALKNLEGVAQQAQAAFKEAHMSFQAKAVEGAPQDTGEPGSLHGASGSSGGEPANDMAVNLDRAIAVMWAASNVSLAINSMTAATSSANTLIKQQ